MDRIMATTLDDTLKKIEAWSKKKSACAWPQISKNDIVNGLRVIALQFYKSNNFTMVSACTCVQQGNYSICGTAAIMFSLVKRDIDGFIDIAANLYETGALRVGKFSYAATSKLRSYAVKKENYYDRDKNSIQAAAGPVCWMFDSTLAQSGKKTGFAKDLNPDMTGLHEAIAMCTRVSTLETWVKSMYPNRKIDEQAYWGTQKNAEGHLNKWISSFNSGSLVFWLMHSTPLENFLHHKNNSYTHAKISDLHWVVVLNAVRKNDNVDLVLHSWGVIYSMTVSLSEFRKMGCHSYILY